MSAALIILQAARLPLQLQSWQSDIERAKRVIVTMRPFALARARDIERRNLFLAHKFGDELRSALRGKFRGIDQLVRPVLLDAKTNCLLSAAAQLVEINNRRGVGIFHILHCAFDKTSVLQFFDRISVGNSAELIQSSRRTPTAAFDPVFQCDIEGRAIYPCLSAGNNFHATFCSNPGL